MQTTPRPELIVFDVNETLSDLAPMARRFEDVGAPGHLADTWFAAVLRDGFALTAAGATARFADLATAVLATLLHPVALHRPLAEATRHVLAGFTELDVHADVGPGVRALVGDGHRLVTLSNGAASVAEGLLARAGLRDMFDATLSVEDAGVWKPAARSYLWAAERCGVEPAAMMLVAVHPWDVDGAHRAGLRTAWVNRVGAPYPATFSAPDVEVRTLVDLAGMLPAA